MTVINTFKQFPVDVWHTVAFQHASGELQFQLFIYGMAQIPNWQYNQFYF